MLTVCDASAFPATKQPRECGFAFDQRQVRQIAAVEMQKVKDVIDEAFPLACLERRLQLGKARNARLGLDYHFAVDQRVARSELGDRGADVGEFFAPIETFAGEQADLAVIEPSLDAIAIELDLVHPPSATRRNLLQSGKRRRHELWQSRAVRPPALVAPAGAALARSLRFAPVARAARALLRSFVHARTS